MKDKRTYAKIKEHGEEMTYENEIKISNVRGPNDLEQIILAQKTERDALQKKVEFLQNKCRQAGAEINELKRDNTLLSYDVATLTNRIQQLEKNVKG
tara:strand:+ start:712 stop:1002 length:291 start_codon:yes stop_codon:yes gene_type:complete